MSKRIVIFDLETTGFNPDAGDRVIEFAGVEIIDRKITGRNFRVLINPEGKRSDAGAFKVHGITDESLLDKPTFRQVLPDILNFIRGAEIVAHNAVGFDEGFFTFEMEKAGHTEPLSEIVDKVSDSLIMIKNINPSLTVTNLDKLCDVYNVDRTQRVVHGALIDCELLAEVYLKMTEGVNFINRADDIERTPLQLLKLSTRPKLLQNSPEDEMEHQKYLDSLEAATKKPSFERTLIAGKSSSPKM